MPRVEKREQARRDLIDQWVWYADNAGVPVADRFLSAAEETLGLLARQPDAGTQLLLDRSELTGIRWFPIGEGFEKILLLYFPQRDGIDLVRVLHRSRDIAAMFEKGEND